MFLEWTTSSLLNQTLTVCKSPESERSSSSSSSSKRMLPQEDLHLFLPNSRNSSFQDKKLFWDLHWHPFSLPPLAAQPKTTHNHPAPSSPPKNYPQQQLEIPPSVCRYNPIYSSSTCNRREQPASQPQRQTHTHTHCTDLWVQCSFALFVGHCALLKQQQQQQAIDDDDGDDGDDENISFNLLMNEHYIGRYILPLPFECGEIGSQLRERQTTSVEHISTRVETKA